MAKVEGGNIIFKQKQKIYEIDKYTRMVKELGETRDIETSTKILKGIKKSLQTKHIIDLRLLKGDVNAHLVDQKNVVLLVSMCTTLMAMLTILLPILEFDLPSNSETSVQNILYGGGIKYIKILCIVIVGLVVIKSIKSFSVLSRRLNQLLEILEIVIKEREEIDKAYTEAYSEYLKFLENAKTETLKLL